MASIAVYFDGFFNEINNYVSYSVFKASFTSSYHFLHCQHLTYVKHIALSNKLKKLRVPNELKLHFTWAIKLIISINTRVCHNKNYIFAFAQQLEHSTYTKWTFKIYPIFIGKTLMRRSSSLRNLNKP